MKKFINSRIKFLTHRIIAISHELLDESIHKTLCADLLNLNVKRNELEIAIWNRVLKIMASNV